MHQTSTTVTCSHCHQVFRLSPPDSTAFLRDMQLEIECPICEKQASLSVIPKFKNKPVSKNALQASSASKSRIGVPSFKPLISQPVQKQIDPVVPKVPFLPIVKEEKPSEPKVVPIKFIIAIGTIVVLSCATIGLWMFNQKNTEPVIYKEKTNGIVIDSEKNYSNYGRPNPRN